MPIYGLHKAKLLEHGSHQTQKKQFIKNYGSHQTKIVFCTVHIRHQINLWFTSDEIFFAWFTLGTTKICGAHRTKILIPGSHQTSDKKNSKLSHLTTTLFLYSHQTKIYSEWFLACWVFILLAVFFKKKRFTCGSTCATSQTSTL